MKKIKIPIILFVSLFLIFPPNLLAEVIGTITYIEGRVDKLNPGQEKYLPVVIGEEISQGDSIRTKGYSKAELTFKDNSIVRLSESSQVKISDYKIDNKAKRENAVIGLSRGKIRTIVSKTGDNAPFIINTPNASGTVRGSDIFVSYQKSATGILVADGVLTTINPAFPDKIIEIPKGSISVVPHNGPPQEPRNYLPVEKKQKEAETGPRILKSAKGAAKINSTSATVARSVGDVRIYPEEKQQWHAASTNETLNAGAVIETKENGRAQLSLNNGHIIELRPNTQFIIKSLAVNVDSGAYENSFECKFGKVRAKLQKIQGKSKFEVKTPTSVCGVLGTIMYLEVLPNLTKAFFEGGNGFVTNIISGQTKTIFAGMSASSDNQGNITEPTETTNEERSAFNSEFGSENTDDDIYGYSSPDGNPGADYFEFGFGQITGGTPNPEWLLLSPFDQIKQMFSSSSIGAGTTPFSMSSLFSGTFGYYDGHGFLSDDESLIAGVLTSTDLAMPWQGGTISTGVYGAYLNPNDRALWSSEITGTTADGASIYGIVNGAMQSWEGVLAALYIDPAKTAGIIFGYLSGIVDETADTFTGTNDIFVIPVSGTDISPADLINNITINPQPYYINIASEFNNNAGYIEAGLQMMHLGINNSSWGIWAGDCIAEYSRLSDLSQWSEAFIGKDSEDGYLFGLIEGIDNLNNSLRLDITATALNPYRLRAYFGSIVGSYQEDELYYFEGVGSGGWEDTPLTFNGILGNDYNQEIALSSLYYNNNGNLGFAGEETGLIGAVISPWSATREFIAVGEYFDYSEGASLGNYIWNTPIQSYTPDAGYITLDGGAFLGVTAGFWNQGLIRGSSVALYMDAGGHIGFLTGPISGRYFSDYGMWALEGLLTPQAKLSYDGENMTPDNFSGFIFMYDMDDIKLTGNFNAEETNIKSKKEEYFGYTRFIVDDSRIKQPFGIFSLALSGTHISGGSNIWKGKIEGSGLFGYCPSGGTMSGDMFGIYDENTWTMTSAGTWESYYADSGATLKGEAKYKGIAYGVLLDDGTIIGKMAAVYEQPFSSKYIKYGRLEGAGSGSFDTGGNILADYIDGDLVNVSNRDFGVFGFIGEGTYTLPESAAAWDLTLNGKSDIDMSNKYSNSYWAADISGSTWSSERLNGDISGIWINSFVEKDVTGKNITVMSVGNLSGNVTGAYEIEGEQWQAVGAGEWVEVSELIDLSDLSQLTNQVMRAADIVSLPITEVYSLTDMAGIGAFNAGGKLSANMDIALYNIEGNLGLFAMLVKDGVYSGSVGSGKGALDFISGPDSARLDILEWSNNKWLADVAAEVSGKILDGKASGIYTDINKETGTGTFNGTGAGIAKTPEALQ